MNSIKYRYRYRIKNEKELTAELGIDELNKRLSFTSQRSFIFNMELDKGEYNQAIKFPTKITFIRHSQKTKYSWQESIKILPDMIIKEKIMEQVGEELK